MGLPSIYRLLVSQDIFGKHQLGQVAEIVGYKAAASCGGLVVFKHFVGYILFVECDYFVGYSIGRDDLIGQSLIVVKADGDDLPVSHFSTLRKS